jgi:hypothetical protein
MDGVWAKRRIYFLEPLGLGSLFLAGRGLLSGVLLLLISIG